MRPHASLLVAILLIGLNLSLVSGDTWPQFRGTDRTNRSAETDLLEKWPSDGPPRVWLYRNAGAGYSGPAVVGSRMYTMGARDGETYLIAIDTASGQALWSTAIAKYYKNNWGDGPRSTPTVDGNMVYALTGKGALVCVGADDGQIVWRRSMKKLGGRVPQWGFSESVLVDGGNLVCTPGGSKGAIVALDKASGDLVWQSEDLTDQAQYASIVPTEHNGQRQFIQLFMDTLASVSASDGGLLWRVDYPGRIAVVPTPIVHDARVYVTADYGVGCMLVDMRSEPASKVYLNKVMKNHHGGVVRVGDYVYGHSKSVGWVCQNFLTGEEVWHEKEKLGKGAVTYADGCLYCLDEQTGAVALISATPQGWQEKGRFVLEPQSELRRPMGAIWTHPVVSDGKLYLRDQDLIYCFDISETH